MIKVARFVETVILDNLVKILSEYPRLENTPTTPIYTVYTYHLYIYINIYIYRI